MALDLAPVKIDARRVERGVWWAIQLGADGRLIGSPLPGEPGDEPALLIRPMDNEWDRAMEVAQAPFRVELREKKLTDEQERRIVAEAIAKALWRGCANITAGGKPVEWSEASAARMMADVAWLNVREFILSVSRDRAALLEQEEAKAAGN